VPIEIGYFYFAGIDGLITTAGVIALFVVYLPIADATFQALAQIFHTVAPLIFVAVAMRSSYLAGALEERRNTRVIAYTGEHITKMNEAAEMVRRQVQGFLESTYPTNAAAGSADLVSALDHHFADLQLGLWDTDATRLHTALEAIRDRATREVPESPTFTLILEPIATSGVAPERLEWSFVSGPGGSRFLHVQPTEMGNAINVTTMNDEEIAALKTHLEGVIREAAASWTEGIEYRRIRESMRGRQGHLLTRLGQISHVDALPLGTRCDLCDPYGAQVR
jgi:hypothetical protein